MTSSSQTAFGTLLRQLRLDAKLSQEELAERARIGVDTIGALERGVNAAPYRSTIARLADALGATAEQRAAMTAAGARVRRRHIVDVPAPGPAPPLAAQARPGNLPAAFPEPIGRDAMLAELAQLVPHRRLVTLAGSGGIGKTCVALALGRMLEPDFTAGVWFIDLVPITDPALLTGKLAAVLGVREAGDRPLLELVLAALRRRRLLLILDNCEHIVAEAAQLTETLRAAAPDVHVVATSREPLKTPGEHVYAVSPLRCPARAPGLTAAAALGYAAPALFAARANAADHRFVLTDDNAEQVAEICRRLEGIALGIELAASRVRVLGLSNLTRRLERLLPTLTGGRRTAALRHQTMRALIDWSYALLDADERRMLQRVSVFAGGWTLEAAEMVGADAGEPGRVLELLSGLVEKSQVVAQHDGAHTRYRLLHAVREYAQEQLTADERAQIERRHAAWVARLADDAAAAGWSVPRRRWLASLTPEIDNIRAALNWAQNADGGAETAARIVAGLGLFWYYSGLAHEGRTRIETLLERLGDGAGEALGASLWGALAALRAGAPRADAARQAIQRYDRLGDRRRLGLSYLQLAIAYRQMADFAAAAGAVDRALALLRETGEQRSTYYASALGWRASALIGLQRFDEARAHFERDIALYDTLDDAGLAAVERLNFAELEFATGNVPRAIELVEAGLDALRAEARETKLGNDYSQAVFYLNLAAYRLANGNTDAAHGAARAALERARSLHYPLYIAIAVGHFATIAALRGDARFAARLRGFVDAVYRTHGLQREPTEASIDAVLTASLRRKLSAHECAALAAEGALLTEDEAVDAALAIGAERPRRALAVRAAESEPEPQERGR